MRVGIRIDEDAPLTSIERIFRSTYQGLSSRFELVLLPTAYPLAPPAERRRMAEAFLERCDVVVGVLDPAVLAARRRLGSSVPLAAFMFGDLPVGGWALRGFLDDLSTGDVLLVSCASEVEIARRLFRNAPVRVVPFAYDQDAFYPLDGEERRAARERLGLGEGARVLLYAGRLMPEKGVHQLLALFDVIAARVPEAHLVLAGSPPTGATLLERFGAAPVWLQNTYAGLVARMERPERVHLVGDAGDRRLRELYGAADLVVNLTLNPDENFGLAQVEAMACGTPVVGTAWGGLKDTIADGVNGFKVSTVPTATGVKLDWWEAVNRVAALLEDGDALRGLRDGCLRTAERYTPARFGAAMEEVLLAAAGKRGRPARPLQPTRFAEELWSVCDPRWPGPAYRRGARSEELHRTLATPFTAVSPAHAPAWEALEPGQVLSLATPVHADAAGSVRLDDVFYARELPVPEAHRAAVAAVLGRMRERPALTVGELAAAGPAPGLEEALAWMLEAGLLLRTLSQPGWIAPAAVGRRLAEASFRVLEVDRAATDLIAYTP